MSGERARQAAPTARRAEISPRRAAALPPRAAHAPPPAAATAVPAIPAGRTPAASRRAATAPRRTVTIQDVARAAGVGRQTVSNVLNGSGRVSADTRRRVLATVESLGYRPHHGARSLRSRRTWQLGYLMPRSHLEPDSFIMTQFLQSLVRASARRDYNVIVIAPEAGTLGSIRRLAASRAVDAFVLSEMQVDDARVELLCELRMPFACMGRIRPGLPQHWADIDNKSAMEAVVDHVAARGFTRLAYVGYRSPQYWDVERAAGFRSGLARNGLGSDAAGVLLVDDACAHEQIESLIASARPTAILAGTDKLAAIVHSVAAEAGLRIGTDLAITGFDGSVLGGLLRPRLTTVTIPVADIAERVVDRALRHMNHGPDGRPGEIVPATLRLGEST